MLARVILAAILAADVVLYLTMIRSWWSGN